MELLTYKYLAALIIFITTIVAVLYPIKIRTRPKHNHFLEYGDAMASGIFLGAALFHMLPDATKGFQESLGAVNYPLAELFCAFGFVLLLFLERLATSAPKIHYKVTIPYFLALTLIVHSLVEGAALGVNDELATASVLFLAIIAHKGSESFALSFILCKDNVLANKQLFWIIGIFSIMTPLGIFLGTSITSFLQFKQSQLIIAGFNAFAAGTFLYMSTLHHIHHHQRLHEAESMWEFLCLLFGLSVMGLIVLWV